jgi:TonB family protein
VKELNARLAVALLAACALTRALAADAPADAAVPFDVEVFKGVQILKGPSQNLYPMTEVMDRREGWVILDLMVDPKGKPYEVMVVDSSGIPAFERAALRGVNDVTFKPAERGGTPIDSSYTFKMKFAIDDLAKEASTGFALTYRRLIKAAQGGDRPAADKALASLKPQNLYEDAFANLAKFHYHRQWGTPAEQRLALERAIAKEEKPTYLPKGTFAVALYSKFRLEVQASDYGSALDTWKVLDPYATPEMRKDLEPVVDQLRTAQASDQRYRQPAVIPERQSWNSVLLRNRFSIVVEKGSVSEIKLRCAQQYLFFKYEPGVQYSIGTKKDRCGIEVVGDPGTQFNLIQ